MKPPVRKTLPHNPPAWVRKEEATFFITMNCQSRGGNQLCRQNIGSSLLDTVRYRHKRGDWWVDIFLLMPDHLHALLSFPSAGDMEKVVRAWKHYTATQLGIRWQRDFF
ncbi:MAG TPA: transposase [Verrucomicrobiae bacterium]|nr:transposase [Verrucomicrobiae bacterium]